MTHEPRLTLRIEQDQDAENPFEAMDQLGEIAHWHRDYRFGSKAEVRLPREKEAIEDWLSGQDKALLLPLYLYDHSGLTIRTSPFSCPWDSGQVGFIFTTEARYRTIVVDSDPLPRNWKSHARKQMQCEVQTLDSYLTGDVWGYIIEDHEGEQIDSCWDFYGEAYCRAEAASQLSYWTDKLCTKELAL